MRKKLQALALGAAIAFATNVANAQEKLTYLFPAPDFLPAFAPFQIHHDVILTGSLTLILVLSSVTMQLGVSAIRRGDRTGFLRNTAITLVLGLTFLAGQVYDYSQLGFGITDTAFGSTFYTLTGFHGAHVLGGAIMLSVVLYRGMAGQFSAKHHDAVEATSIYWHFVDVVWIALFSTLYLL